MKTAIIALCALAFCAITCVDAIRPSDYLSAVLEQQNEGLLHSLTGLLQSEKPSKEHGAYALVKFIVKPSKAEGFIEAFEKSKDGAEKYDGYIGYYLVKTVDDNITYISWAAWKSIEDLADYLKSDDAREFIEYTQKEDIVTLISGVRPVA